MRHFKVLSNLWTSCCREQILYVIDKSREKNRSLDQTKKTIKELTNAEVL